MKKIFFLYVPIILLIASCKKKDYPQNISEEPAFYISGNIDGKPITFNAGIAGYYMYSSFKQDTNNMYTFVGEVKSSNCTSTTSCNNSLKIEINDNQFSVPNGTSNINNSIKTGGYLFAHIDNTPPSVVAYAVQYNSSFNHTATPYNVGYTWDFKDGGTSTLANPTHTFSSSYTHDTTFLYISDGNLDTYIYNRVKLTTNPNPCRTHISIYGVSGNTVGFINNTSGGLQPYTYRWDFGDHSGFYTDPNPQHTYTATGIYKATLLAIDAKNDTAYHNYYINTDQSDQPAPNFYVNSITPVYSNPLTSLFSKVKISYTDNNGMVYSSNIQPQILGGSNFQIVSVDEYKKNENNQSTKKIKITFNCQLFNGTNVINVTNGEAVLAVSYK